VTHLLLAPFRFLALLAHALGCTACRGDYCCPVARRRGLVAANRPWDVRARGTLDRF